MPLRISLDWLKQYIELPEPPEQLAEALTLSGTEVEQIIKIGVGWEGVVVARIVEADLVKGSDHLKLVRLEVGDGAAQVVSGAPNIRVGDLVALAPPGTRLPNGMEISERKFMGELSQGMMCSPIELGISSEADGLLVLGTDGPTGIPLTELLPEDRVMVIEVTTNRPDLLCHLGIARELSALLRRPLSPLLGGPLEGGGAEAIAVEVVDAELCARYSARAIDAVSVGPSPAWMQRRLRAVGQRPISNVVDAANYVMLETGQPLHAFDRDRLEGGIVVRQARAGESIDCLDGKTRELEQGMLVIADASRPVAIAGIIGGADSAVSPATRRIVIEAANFNGISIRATSRRLGLRTEASTRFEKQLHPELVPPASARMAELVQEIAGGGPSSAVVEDYPRPVVNAPIRTRAGYFAETLGDDIPDSEAVDDLGRLHFEVDSPGQGLVATPPNFRLDVREPIDLVEEVGRLHGYNSLPSTLPGRRLLVERILPPPDPEWEARDIAMGAGYDEVINTSFEPPGGPELGVFPTARLRLTNPMASDQALMRTSLLPGLSRAVARNVALDVDGVRIFELGRVFWPQPGQELPQESRVIGVAAHVPSGAAQPPAGVVRTALLEVKGFFELLTGRLSEAALSAEQTAIAGFHPGRGVRLDVDGAAAGAIGQLHPELAARLGVSAVVLGELNFDAIVAKPRVPRHFPAPKFPAVVRDLALTVPELTLARDAILVIRAAGGAILRSVELYDEYFGAQVGEGRKGLTFRLVFQSDERTLTGEEVSAAETRIVTAARSGLSAEPRG
jgi:phenylalanyl-tRNA synthetase beta chain